MLSVTGQILCYSPCMVFPHDLVMIRLCVLVTVIVVVLHSVNENKMTTAAAVVATVLATPLAAQAVDATPSVSALLGSVVNGGVVVALIAGAISLVSGFDTVNRGR